MLTDTCIEGYEDLVSDSEFTCYGTLMYKLPQTPNSNNGNFRFRCTSDEAYKYTGDDHDCICSSQQKRTIKPCKGNQQSIRQNCSSDQGRTVCSIHWQGKPLYKVTSDCTTIRVENQCKVKCRTNGKDTVLCQETIQCDASIGEDNAETCVKTKKASTQSSSTTGDDVHSTLPTTSTKSNTFDPIASTKSTTSVSMTSTKSTTFVPITKAPQTAARGSEDTVVIALGVVAGLAILALVATLILVFLFRRRKHGRKMPSTNVYMDMNTSDVGSTTYETSMGNKKHHDRLENECHNVKDHTSGLYMDIDDSDQTKQQHCGAEATVTDNIYNSIDEYEPNDEQGYAPPKDLPQPSQDLACPVDIPVASANYFVLEKQEERPGESSEHLAEDLNPTGNYFALDKDEDSPPSDPTQKIDCGIVNKNKADNYFILEEQTNEQNSERVPNDNYFLFEKETGPSEDTPIGDTYNSLNGDSTTDNGDYSHARGIPGSSQESTARETTVEGNSEDYDHLFQKNNNNHVYDADNDYDHTKNDDIPT